MIKKAIVYTIIGGGIVGLLNLCAGQPPEYTSKQKKSYEQKLDKDGFEPGMPGALEHKINHNKVLQGSIDSRLNGVYIGNNKLDD